MLMRFNHLKAEKKIETQMMTPNERTEERKKNEVEKTILR